MYKKKGLILIDQATRDAFPQLLLAQYLRSKGVKVFLSNQGTFLPICERSRPDVVFISWTGDAAIMSYLQQIRRRPHIVVMDQEGGRLRKETVRREYDRFGGAKRKMARMCAKLFTWGPMHAQWLEELEVARKEQILVTGSPKFDPYLIAPAVPQSSQRKYIGVTLRGDSLTSSPGRFMEDVYFYRDPDEVSGLTVSYPTRTQIEDRVWHVTASTRFFFKVVEAVTKRSNAPIVFRPGPWERPGVYDFLLKVIPNAAVRPGMLQHDYVRGAFVILDESSTLGLEGLLVGTPVISIQLMIPGLEDHIGGMDSGLFEAPYTRYYWKPKSIDEAVEYILKAEKGELPVTPDPEGLKEYLHSAYTWPRSRPSSFVIGDAILNLLDMPTNGDCRPEPPRRAWRRTFKTLFYRYLPGSISLMTLRFLAQILITPDRHHLRRYHYFSWLYPHSRDARELFTRLQERDISLEKGCVKEGL